MKEKLTKEKGRNYVMGVVVVKRVLGGIALGSNGSVHLSWQSSGRSDTISGALEVPSKTPVQQCLPVSQVSAWGFDPVLMLFLGVVNSAANHIVIEFLNFFSELNDRLQKQFIAFRLVNGNKDCKYCQNAGHNRTNIDHDLLVLEKQNNDRQQHRKNDKKKQRVQKVGNWVINNFFDPVFNQVANLHFYLRGVVKSCLGNFDSNHAFGAPFISAGVL